MKTLYIHIGTAKTATTTIQQYCGLNRDVLAEKGLCFPIMPIQYKRISVNRNGRFLYSEYYDENGVRSKEKENELRIEGLDYVVKCFEEYDNVLLSDESIWWATSGRLKRLWSIIQEHSKKHGYTVKLIVYFRRQDQFMLSRYNQNLKTDTNASTQRFYEYFKDMNGRFKCVMNYLQRLDYAAKFFGEENIIVRRFDRNFFYKGSIINDFLKTMDIEVTDDFKELEADANDKLSVQVGEVKRILNRLGPFTKEENERLVNMLNECEETLPEEKLCMMSKEHIEKFMKKFIESNEIIAEKYIGDGKPMFNYDYPDIPKWGPESKNFYEEVILLFARMCGDLHKSNEALKTELKESENNFNGKLAKQKESFDIQLHKIKIDVRDLKYAHNHPIKTFYNKVKNKFKRK